MDIGPIKTEDDYDAALAEIDRLMGSRPDTPEGDKLNVLVTLVEAYEDAHWPIEAPDPISAIGHVMEANGWKQRDFATLIGSQPHASEVLRRRRPLNAVDDPGSVDRVESPSRHPGAGVSAGRLTRSIG